MRSARAPRAPDDQALFPTPRTSPLSAVAAGCGQRESWTAPQSTSAVVNAGQTARQKSSPDSPRENAQPGGVESKAFTGPPGRFSLILVYRPKSAPKPTLSGKHEVVRRPKNSKLHPIRQSVTGEAPGEPYRGPGGAHLTSRRSEKNRRRRNQQEVGGTSGYRRRTGKRGTGWDRRPEHSTPGRTKQMEFKGISDVIVRRLEGRCRFQIDTTGQPTAGHQVPGVGLYRTPSRLRCVRTASTRFENALNAWLGHARGPARPTLQAGTTPGGNQGPDATS